MEEKLFPRPAVAGVLKEKFIEARLHNDGRGSVYDEIVRLQAEKAKTSATPNYLIVDPSTGETLRSRAGVMRESTFLEFLEGKGTE
jgi:hypothetical protein